MRRKECPLFFILSVCTMLVCTVRVAPGQAIASPPVPPNSETAQNATGPSPAPNDVPLMSTPDIRLDSHIGPTATITGTVVDMSGAVVSGALVRLTRPDSADGTQIMTNENGQFTFSGVTIGPFQVTIASSGFVTQTSSGTLHPDQTYIVPTVRLALSEVITRIRVLPEEEVAEQQIKQAEKQRVLGVFPNFYVTYFSDAVPLTRKQKFELAWKSVADPFTFAITAGVAGTEQAENSFSEYGEGAPGYGKRFAAFYADTAAGTFVGSAILPSLLRQDPRYFYKGTGSARSRMLYALANAVICRGDDLRWQPNYSNVLGSFAAGGISNFYYPRQNRGAGLVAKGALINIGAGAAANVLQEFVVRRFTPKLPSRDPNAVFIKLRKLAPAFAHEG